MDFRNFTDFAFYDLITSCSQLDAQGLPLAVKMYKRRSGLSCKQFPDLDSCITFLENKKADPSFRLACEPESVRFKESLFCLAQALGCADIDWQDLESVERLWKDEKLWQKEEALKLKVNSCRIATSKSTMLKALIESLQDRFFQEYQQRKLSVLELFNDLWNKAFLSPGETKKIQDLQEAIRVLTKSQDIIDKHKLLGLKALREQMTDFQSTLPINARQLVAFLTLAKIIRANLEFFKKINENLEKIKVSCECLSKILGEPATPIEVYKEWFKLVSHNRRELQKALLISDICFLKEILVTLHKVGWHQELINLVPAERELCRIDFKYPKQWPDVVDAYRAFGDYIHEWQKSS